MLDQHLRAETKENHGKSSGWWMDLRARSKIWISSTRSRSSAPSTATSRKDGKHPPPPLQSKNENADTVSHPIIWQPSWPRAGTQRRSTKHEHQIPHFLHAHMLIHGQQNTTYCRHFSTSLSIDRILTQA